MESKKWVAVWGNAPSVANTRPTSYAKDITLRYNCKTTVDAQKIRLQFTNFCGREDVSLAKVTVGINNGGNAVCADTLKTVLFGGSTTAVIKKGGNIKSDEIDLKMTAGQSATVSIYLKDFTDMRTCVHITGILSDGWFALGDKTGAGVLPIDDTRKINSYYFLNTLEVLTDSGASCCILYGDSITAEDWPDYLTQIIVNSGRKDIATLRRAASGTRVLGRYDCAEYAHYGLSGKDRFESETDVAGADTVFVLHGINDIIHPDGINPWRPMSNMPTAEDLINGFRYYIKIAHKKGLKIVFSTLLPIKNWRTYAPFRETVRRQVNDWIKNTDETDGYIDLSAAVEDPADRTAFKDIYDSGDHLHPSAAGYEKMAQTFFDAFYKVVRV